MSGMAAWQRRMAGLNPKQKKTGVILLVGTVVFAIILMLTSKAPTTQRRDDKLAVEVVTPSKRNIDVENLNASITALQRQLQETQARQVSAEGKLAEALSSLSDQIGKGPNSEDIDRRVAEAVRKNGGNKPSTGPEGNFPLPAPGTAPALGTALPGAPPGANAGAGGNTARGIQLSGDDEDEEGRESTGVAVTTTDRAGKAKRTPGAWFPMGTILSGVAMNGGDFPVSNAARRDPLPMLVRIKKDAILPNNARASVKECFAMISGTGDMSASRAMLRAERLSCVLDGGRSVEVPLNGYVVGEDGKPGLYGKLVTKEAETIAKALRVGIVGAVGVGLTGWLSQELSASSGNVNVNLGGAGNGGGGAGGNGGAAPIGKSFEKITEYYSSLAKEIVPVVEINPLRQIDIVLVRGLEIPVK
ncbi:TrbI/VirB10 family protein [Noviherbaspirillum galbum]|uniref:Conjugal transfer protein TraB n=1 Tax=Noviherbaspirillum galbum TaxID=2709383 RepID=A0A6B3SRM3_9BURK|nr:TrbI/VirB10 family protein [Noviherbaspirillum galbum]NEX63393.1 hypothetical protein [Noviherbaspirillum galbum]